MSMKTDNKSKRSLWLMTESVVMFFLLSGVGISLADQMEVYTHAARIASSVGAVMDELRTIKIAYLHQYKVFNEDAEGSLRYVRTTRRVAYLKRSESEGTLLRVDVLDGKMERDGRTFGPLDDELFFYLPSGSVKVYSDGRIKSPLLTPSAGLLSFPLQFAHQAGISVQTGELYSFEDLIDQAIEKDRGQEGNLSIRPHPSRSELAQVNVRKPKARTYWVHNYNEREDWLDETVVCGTTSNGLPDMNNVIQNWTPSEERLSVLHGLPACATVTTHRVNWQAEGPSPVTTTTPYVQQHVSITACEINLELPDSLFDPANVMCPPVIPPKRPLGQ